MGKRIIILGGLGFIGRNLYNHLVDKGYDVTILTRSIEGVDDPFLTPAVLRNIKIGSIADKVFMEEALKGYQVVFSLAGSSGAADSIKDPYKELDTNLKGHLNILEACRKNNPDALLVFPSSRLVYGKPKQNPVNEDHALNPESIYAINKIAIERYYLLYQKLYGMNCVILRIANPFGPYQHFGSNQYGILNWFIHKALNNEAIDIYGDGSQMRDFIFVDDLVNLLRTSIDCEKMFGKTFNLGCGTGISIRESVEIISKYVSDIKVNYRPWPSIDQKIETGDYISDIRFLQRESGWRPLVSFEDGIRRTIEFYKK